MVEKPSESLEAFLKEQFEKRLPGYKKLIRAMRELEVDQVYQFRAALERAEKDETNGFEQSASLHWGRLEIKEVLRLYGGHALIRRASDEVSAEMRDEEAAREVEEAPTQVNIIYSQNNPAPDDASVDVLYVTDHFTTRIKNCFKAQGMKNVGDVLKFSEAQWREVPGFGSRSLWSLKHALKEVGRSLDEPRFRINMTCPLG